VDKDLIAEAEKAEKQYLNSKAIRKDRAVAEAIRKRIQTVKKEPAIAGCSYISKMFFYILARSVRIKILLHRRFRIKART